MAGQREAAGTVGDGSVTSNWSWFLRGVAVALVLVLLALIFTAYQMPELLLDWANLRYCG